eukprot:g13540.t1
MAQQPCLIKNAITDIPAIRKQHWSRQNFLRRYGQLQVKADSRSNLPFAQGESNNKMTLEEYLNRSKTYLKARLPNHEFVFDFFDAMKADYVGNKKMTKLLNKFLKDIPAPKDHQEDELFDFFKGHSDYRMLSLGGNAGGIDFHFHGDTWLALVHGVKSWYIYPPGRMPAHVHKQLNLITANWKKVSVDDNRHGKPIYCQQRGGQILYLPQFKNQCVHAGFYEHMKLSLPKVVKILAENDCKPETTVLTGHSLGGATATLAAVEGIGKRLYTYGAPRSLCQSCPSELQSVKSHRFVTAYIAKHTNNKRDYTEIYDIVPQGFLGSGIIRKLINGVIGLHDTNNYVKVLAKVSPEPLLHDLTYKALAKADPYTDYDKPAISEEAFEEASKEMYNDANGDDDEKNDPGGSDDAKNDPSGSDNAGGIVDSNTMTSSNADNGDVKNGAKISAEDDSTPTSGLKQRIMNEIKINKNPSTLKSVENILHELNTH